MSGKQYEEAPELTDEDDAILDRVWARRAEREKNPTQLYKITLVRDEHQNGDADTREEAETWEAADAILRRWSQLAPDESEGYHKVSYVVEWNDGTRYAGRYDLSRGLEQVPALNDGVRRVVEFYSGATDLGQECERAERIRRSNPAFCAMAKNLHDGKYALED